MVSVPVEEAGQRKINLNEDHPGGKQRQQVHSVPVAIRRSLKYSCEISKLNPCDRTEENVLKYFKSPHLRLLKCIRNAISLHPPSPHSEFT